MSKGAGTDPGDLGKGARLKPAGIATGPAPLTVGSLFAGIGGLDLGLERAGMSVRWQVENDPWCTRVLAKHWPHVERYGDVHDLNPADLEPVDLIAGGFPCQPVSTAGKQLGQEDDRWLWPEFARLVRGMGPRYVLVENVPGLALRGMGDILGDLAGLGYDTEWASIPAAAVGAPHLRYRIFIVAHSHRDRRPRRPESDRTHRPVEVETGDNADRRRIPRAREGDRATPVADTDSPRPAYHRQGTAGRRITGEGQRPTVRPASGQCRGIFTERPAGVGEWWAVEPDVGRVAYGVPARVDRLRGLGNAVVPQVAEWVARRILEYERAPSGGLTRDSGAT